MKIPASAGMAVLRDCLETPESASFLRKEVKKF
jgi:hypothetical protein